jgi:two-component system, OmpR family, sensor kinase
VPPGAYDSNARSTRFLAALQRLLAISIVDERRALDEAASLVGEALGADQVEVFLYDASTKSLVIVTTLDSMTGMRQRASGLDRLLLAGGGLTVKVFQSGGCYQTGHADQEPDERQDIVDMLGIRSEILCCLRVNGDVGGVLLTFSSQPDYFSEGDESFVDAAARWMGLVVRCTELMKQIASDAVQENRRRIADAVRQLTPREREVAVLVASGLTNEQIAERLVLVPGTVSNHIFHILRKLGFSRRAQIATWTVQHGLWTPDAG